MRPIWAISVEYMVKTSNEYTPETHGVGQFGVMCTTGPITLSRCINSILIRFPRKRFRHPDTGFRVEYVKRKLGNAFDHAKLYQDVGGRRHCTQESEPVVIH